MGGVCVCVCVLTLRKTLLFQFQQNPKHETTSRIKAEKDQQRAFLKDPTNEVVR